MYECVAYAGISQCCTRLTGQAKLAQVRPTPSAPLKPLALGKRLRPSFAFFFGFCFSLLKCHIYAHFVANIFLCRLLVVSTLLCFFFWAEWNVVSFYGIASCLLLALYWFSLRVSPVTQKYAIHIAYSIYNMCILCALIFYIRTHTHHTTSCTHTHTDCGCARISIVCTLCDIFMRPNFVASNLRCVWVTTAVAISLPHLWQIFLCCFCRCCCCFASQTTCVVKSTLAFISHQATTRSPQPTSHNQTESKQTEPPIKQPRNPKSICYGEECESKGHSSAFTVFNVLSIVMSFGRLSIRRFCYYIEMQLNNAYGKCVCVCCKLQTSWQQPNNVFQQFCKHFWNYLN